MEGPKRLIGFQIFTMVSIQTVIFCTVIMCSLVTNVAEQHKIR